MKLHTVTITGSDNSVTSEDLEELSQKYPFVEWGILMSSKRQGSERYPSDEWIKRLNSNKLRLSAHICGRWSRDIVNKGILSIKEENPDYWSLFKRIQVNYNTKDFKPNDDFLDIISLIHDRKIIMQVNDFTVPFLKELRKVNDKVIPLFDTSGGRGLSPLSWPVGEIDCWHGYSGGINLDNIEESLVKIDKTSKGKIWIDLETGCRTENNGVSYFDIDKVDKILYIASKFISTDVWYNSVISTPSGIESLKP